MGPPSVSRPYQPLLCRQLGRTLASQVGERQSVFLGVAVTIQLLAKLTNRVKRRQHESAEL